MTLADMMLMILEIRSDQGIWEPLFQTVNQPDVRCTHTHLFAAHRVGFSSLLRLLCSQVFLCFSLINKAYAGIGNLLIS